MTDINELDEIMSGAGDEPVAELENTEATQERDEQGRFASKEQAAEPEQETAQEPEAEDPRVPLAAVHEARTKAKEEREARERVERELAEMRGQMQVLLNQRQQPQPQQEKASPDFWDDPNAFVTQVINPVQQRIERQREEFSMTLAIDKHGKDTVEKAYQAMGAAMQAGDPQALASYQSIMASPHPYGSLVEWHKRHESMSMVGNDPMAWFESEFEKRLGDPEQQAKILERIRGTATAAVDRSQPQVQLPKSLSRVPGGVSEDNDMSDTALFSHATR